jgi:hypothetical protein
MKHPLQAARLSVTGVRTTGPMAKDIPLDHERPAKFVFSSHVDAKLAEIRAQRPRARNTVQPVA